MTRTPTQQLQKIRIDLNNVDRWMSKVTGLIALGADVGVLDTYNGESIISCYVATGIDQNQLMRVVMFLLDIGVMPSAAVFVSCLNTSIALAELVMIASGNTIDVNELDFYGVPASRWAMHVIIKRRHDPSVKYLISKGLRTDTKYISIDDIIAAHDKPYGSFH